MINITINDDYKYIEISGHAGMAEEGRDIVCSACSMCLMMMINALSVYDIKHDFETRKGFAFVRIESDSIKAQFLYDYSVLGFELLQENYPQFVQISR